ncbi:AAA family ATPase [Acinetobacter baumannii]|uniref:AAA family ATPase n=1 Tax=Acinetobacter baumannii TaxID=470 RepID=UPI000DE67C81|nr:ATP-binding protein [Acinetobacter baumannii]SSR51357.1 recombination protein F [Acinetobacter baumannii]
MFHHFRISSFKSIKNLEISVGHVNVIIGENGAGKSNFLEALAVFSAGLSNKLDNEFLTARGIRVVSTETMFSIFSNQPSTSSSIFAFDPLGGVAVMLDYDKESPYPTLNHNIGYATTDIETDKPEFFYTDDGDGLLNQKIEELYKNIADKYGSVDEYDKKLRDLMSKNPNKIKAPNSIIEDLFKISPYLNIQSYFESYKNKKELRKKGDFVIYSPEASKLRIFESESQIEPLGVNGEGLLKLLRVMKEHENEKYTKILEIASMFHWVDNIFMGEKEDSKTANKIEIHDRFMDFKIDHRSANEGFLFVLFYAALFSSKFTPDFFAVDNIDASLNPKLCRVLIKELIKLAKENDKQAFVTTHNPAILDGLDLHDDEQRLFVVERDDEGATQLRRVGVDDLPKPTRSGQSIKLSESFMRGFLGGLPTNF